MNFTSYHNGLMCGLLPFLFNHIVAKPLSIQIQKTVKRMGGKNKNKYQQAPEAIHFGCFHRQHFIIRAESLQSTTD